MSSNRLWWVQPETMGYDPIGLGRMRDDGLYVRYFGFRVPLIAIGYACHGDYDNSSAVEVANERALWDMGDEVTRVLRHLYGDYGWQGVALTLPGPVQRDLRKRVEAGEELDADDAIAALREYLEGLEDTYQMEATPRREVLDVLDALDDYPLIDEELFSEVEQEIAHESWNDWAWEDLVRAVDQLVGELPDEEVHLIQQLDDADPEQALWWAQSGDHGGFSPSGDEWGAVETHDTAYFRTDDMAAAVVKCWRTHGMLPWDYMAAEETLRQEHDALF